MQSFGASLLCNDLRKLVERIRPLSDYSFLAALRVARHIECPSDASYRTEGRSSSASSLAVSESNRFPSLVGSFQMIVVLKFLAKYVHVLVPEYHKIVETFLLYCLNKSLDVGNCIWRSKSSSLRFDLCFGERCKKRFGVFAVVVMHQNLARNLDLLGMFDECFGLLDHPASSVCRSMV